LEDMTSARYLVPTTTVIPYALKKKIVLQMSWKKVSTIFLLFKEYDYISVDFFP